MNRRWFALLFLLAAPDASADWTASGRFQYVDRPYGLDGFTGEELPLPVREADIEVIDANRNGNSAILARGSTAQDGSFEIFLADDKIRDVYVRVLTGSDQTSDLFIEVKSGTGNNAPLYAAVTDTLLDHPPGVSVDFGTATVQIGQGAEAFNIFDQLRVGADFLAYLNGTRPGSADALTAVWGYANGLGTAYYAGFGTIMLRDSAAFDDTVILHEMGHFAVERFSDSDNPGGSHGFTECGQDVRLAYDEGFATYWGNAAIRHGGAAGSHVYLRTNGGPGPGNAVRSADLEGDPRYDCRGSASEVNVFTLLWDITDGPWTADDTPDLDETYDQVALPDGEIWEVVTGPVATADNVSLGDLWDGWFLPPVLNGYIPEMIGLARRLSIGHYPDEQEPNDVPADAAPIASSGSWVAATFFADPDLDGSGDGAGDVDLFAFDAVQGRALRIRTFALAGDTQTRVVVLDETGSNVLVEDVGMPGSLLTFEPLVTGRHLLRVTQAAPLAAYGSYRLSILEIGREAPTPLAESDSSSPVELRQD